MPIEVTTFAHYECKVSKSLIDDLLLTYEQPSHYKNKVFDSTFSKVYIIYYSKMSFSMLSAQICGILGVAGLAIFIIGGKQDNDGQGTNTSPYLKR